MAAATRWRSSTRRAYASDPLGDLSLAKTTEWTAAVRKKRPFHGARRRTATPMRRAKRRLEPDPRLLAGHFARHRTRFAHPEAQLDMSDYKSNVALYPTFQEYFRTHTPPLLAAWGQKRPILPAGEGRGVQARHRERDCPLLRYQTFRAGDACPRGRGGHSRLPA